VKRAPGNGVLNDNVDLKKKMIKVFLPLHSFPFLVSWRRALFVATYDDLGINSDQEMTLRVLILMNVKSTTG
jgi:hypothetical protein